jgi:hypothetical protein
MRRKDALDVERDEVVNIHTQSGNGSATKRATADGTLQRARTLRKSLRRGSK